jgi:pre-mRNA cleavage complex 2 protein Pcf11
MSAGLPSDEVVDDYKNSLDDLVTNDRISIGNLTVIAKECIEHAQAIARVLENHILRVSLQLPYGSCLLFLITLKRMV